MERGCAWGFTERVGSAVQQPQHNSSPGNMSTNGPVRGGVILARHEFVKRAQVIR